MDRNARTDLIPSWIWRLQAGRQSAPPKGNYGESGGAFAATAMPRRG